MKKPIDWEKPPRPHRKNRVLKVIFYIIGAYLILFGIIFIASLFSTSSKFKDVEKALTEIEASSRPVEFDMYMEYLEKMKDSIAEDTALQNRVISVLRVKDGIRDLMMVRATQQYFDNLKESVKLQFDAWDGSHRKLNEYIKSQINDPGSFEHVNTRYDLAPDYLHVTTEFTAKNIYGGRERHIIKANCDLSNGNVLDIIKYE